MSSILIEAESIVNGPEQDNRKYGPPAQVFQEYADIFNAINPSKIKLAALDIAYVMKSVKMGRERNHHKRDNLVDDAGYTDIIRQVRGE